MLQFTLKALGIALLIVGAAAVAEFAGFSAAGAVGGVVGGVVGGLLVTKLAGKPPCPRCGTELPQTRKPTSFKQTLWGGWTCPTCSAEVDRHGREILKAH